MTVSAEIVSTCLLGVKGYYQFTASRSWAWDAFKCLKTILFVCSQTATLTNGIQLEEEPNKLDSSDSDSDDAATKPKKRQLTDEEMFKACKGMTAHK